jgi:hypothetical protein
MAKRAARSGWSHGHIYVPDLFLLIPHLPRGVKALGIDPTSSIAVRGDGRAVWRYITGPSAFFQRKPTTMNKPDYRFIGKPIRRAEDERLITGRGRFSDDFLLDRRAMRQSCVRPIRMRASAASIPRARAR